MNDLKAAVGMLQASIGLSQKFKASKPVIIPMETAKTALAALRDALRRQEGCECCADNKGQFFAASTVDKVTKSQYCGLCGRRLEGGE